MAPELGGGQNIIKIFLDLFVLLASVLQSGCYSSASFFQMSRAIAGSKVDSSQGTFSSLCSQGGIPFRSPKRLASVSL